jgi:apolipoprotein N-acyltransferase
MASSLKSLTLTQDALAAYASKNSTIKAAHMLKAIFTSPYFIALILGAAAGFALPPVNSLPLTLGLLSAFFYGFLRLAPSKPAFYSYCFALGYFLTGLYWIGNALLVDGNDYKWAWPLAVFALPAVLALFYGASAALILKPFKHADHFTRVILFAQSIMIAELARSFLFNGFPWNLIGTPWANYLPTIQLASVIGLFGMTWLMLIICALFAYGLLSSNMQRKIWSIGAAFILITLNVVFGVITLNSVSMAAKPNLHVIAIQPNIAQSEKWNPLYAQKNMEKLVRTSEEAINLAPDKTLPIVLIWPETALSYHSTERENFFPSLMARLSHDLKNDVNLITGALTREINTPAQRYDYQNVALYIDENGKVAHRYAKTHLVPFGEYIPFQKFIPLKTVTGFNGFKKGNGGEVFSTKNGLNFMPKICYEIIFPHEIATTAARYSASNKAHNAIIHITNDGWYGNSSGPHQHQSIASIRAIESNAHVFRSANKGISSLISPHGRALAKTNLEHRGYASTDISLDNSNTSIYTRFGIRVVLVLTFMPVLAFLILNGYKKRSNREKTRLQ